ncbi:carboxypeptidase regulatory-like domain-containing protein [Longimicrobium sp.]|uniref:carboxypeptidase regulatory-like domain-containing protein n=1 Tax=Longimicrobium sp. TaxID=2029185 RepID=UPI002BA42C8D|nr:carboxypeptidase regulatory-like domain-containing protein [Longimicrobium sp.]HSU15611.1 carboxypeptidase regulatory-like domain-containing protein [Longimicrobium sp.]
MEADISHLRFCDEDWGGMEPLGPDRRLCARCSRPVVDMRHLTLDEITEIHLWSEERVCGFYAPEHFAPAASSPPRRGRPGLVTLALGASLLAARAEAQPAAPAAREHVQLPPGAAAKPGDAPHAAEPDGAARADTLIHGRVRAADGTPVVAATVAAEVHGAAIRAVTDTAGRFVLRIPPNADRELTLRVYRIGFEPTTLSIETTGRQIEIHVSLAASATIGLGSIVAVGPVETARRREGFSVARLTVSNP